MERKEVYKNLDKERDHQDNNWICRNSVDDKDKPISEWIIYIEHHLNQAKNNLYYLNQVEALAEIRKVTALGVVTLEIHGCPERE